MEKQICKQKQNLVEKLGVLMENTESLAPLASRILAFIILTGKAGTTFEDLVEQLAASKSSISTHLNHLQNLEKITYFTKPGDRKKYFIINKDMVIQGIDKMIASWSDQKALHQEIKAYKEHENENISDESIKFDTDLHDDYIQFLDEAMDSVSELRHKITLRHKTN
ncbi:GbsR/MarR family transcriptional regulator [Gaetbulibacter aestuarii]|uniref:Transcriptional regulator n=1 Tax=Gaetbulibacter aestuarii TaxID=1502358 RepID=A0ABW7MZY8_9FLAO